MGLLNILGQSVVKVISGILGFVLFIGGGQQVAYGGGPIPIVIVLVGVVLMVFAAKI